jgi:lipase maturation factor 1
MERSAPASPGVPPSTFAFSAWLFLRLLAVVHAIAFVSFWTQLSGLIGPQGLLPAGKFFAAVHAQLGPSAYWELPSLCWIFGTGAFLHVLCATGVMLAALLFLGVAPAPCLGLLWVCYLSLFGAGQMFLGFQWDTLLLETTLLAIFLAPWTARATRPVIEPPRIGRWLLWWLLIRLMLLSGAVKLTSGDPTWRDGTALLHHFETQPLPTPLAWYVQQWPPWALRSACAGMFAIELIAPLCLLGPRRLRHAATLFLLLLQLLIALTGNYTFFNLLTVALCVLCLDDAWWRSVLHRPALVPAATEAHAAPRWLLRVFGGFVLAFTGFTALPGFGVRLDAPAAFSAMAEAIRPFASLNTYGLFAVMTHPRPELIFEGSEDGRTWLPYEFPHKPGDLARRPDFIAPLQPRLDWQLWFAALESPEQNQWVLLLCEHLLRGSPEVLALLAHNPFPTQPPRFIRVVRYEYHFTDAAEHARTGDWWRRTPLDYYVQPVSLH